MFAFEQLMNLRILYASLFYCMLSIKGQGFWKIVSVGSKSQNERNNPCDPFLLRSAGKSILS